MTVSRRDFLARAMMGAAAVASASALSPISSAFASDKVASGKAGGKPGPGHYKVPHKLGMGGVALGNGFMIETSDAQAEATMQAAWDGGVRYFDTSPWYGLGLSERRMGHFLHRQKREEYILSTKIGRILTATDTIPKTQWANPSPFDYTYDYSASATRRSIEDSLQRMGISSIDVVFIHDLTPDTNDIKDRYEELYKQAQNGAMPELTKMREEGIIKGWGLGVNTVEPILRTLEVTDPDIFLAAAQYSLLDHEDSIARLFPACEKKNTWLVIGSPYNAGFLVGRERYNYKGTIPDGAKDKRAKMNAIAKRHGIELRTAALQFCMAPKMVASVIPGARSPEQVKQNIESSKARVPADFWAELKKEKLLAENAPVPK